MSAILEDIEPELTENRQLRVLVVDEEIPFPLTSGKRIRTYNLLRHVARRHAIKFLCHRNMEESERDEAKQAFDDLGIETVFLERDLPIQTLLTPKLKLLFQLTKNYFSHYPFLVQKHVSKELCDRISEFVDGDEIDLVHFEWTPYAAVADEIGHKNFSKPWVIDAHNVESLIWKRYIENENNPIKRMLIRHQWKKFDRFEKHAFQSASEMIFVSEPDSKIAADDYGCENRNVVDNGVDTEFFQPSSEYSRNPNELLFLGSLDWRPNVDGVQLLLEKILPEIVKHKPDVHLNIVGRKPADWLVDLIADSGHATLHADVPDVRPFLQKCGMLVVPLRIGGGSRLKILEALACETPVVSSRVGAEGLDVVPGKHFIAAEEDTMASEVVKAIENQDELKSTAREGREIVLNQYDWKVLSKRLEQLWSSVVNGDQVAN